MYNIFSLNACPLRDNVGKHCKAGKPQMITWRIRILSWIIKATNTFSECVILFAVPLQGWLHERGSTLRHTYIAHLVKI